MLMHPNVRQPNGLYLEKIFTGEHGIAKENVRD